MFLPLGGTVTVRLLVDDCAAMRQVWLLHVIARVAAQCCKLDGYKSVTRRGIQPTVPINDATLNDSNVNKFVLPGSVQCYVLKTNIANVMGQQFARCVDGSPYR